MHRKYGISDFCRLPVIHLNAAGYNIPPSTKGKASRFCKRIICSQVYQCKAKLWYSLFVSRCHITPIFCALGWNEKYPSNQMAHWSLKVFLKGTDLRWCLDKERALKGLSANEGFNTVTIALMYIQMSSITAFKHLHVWLLLQDSALCAACEEEDVLLERWEGMANERLCLAYHNLLLGREPCLPPKQRGHGVLFSAWGSQSCFCKSSYHISPHRYVRPICRSATYKQHNEERHKDRYV